MNNYFIANNGQYEIVKDEMGFEVWNTDTEDLVATWGFENWNMEMEDHEFIKIVKETCENEEDIILFSIVANNSLMNSEKFIKIAIKQSEQNEIYFKTIKQCQIRKYLNVNYNWNMSGSTLENGIYVWWNSKINDTLIFTGGIEETGFNESLNFNQIEYLKKLNEEKIKVITSTVSIQPHIINQTNLFQIA
ncbi:hypothetical protein KHQ81_15435 (plasmid) [Mycoplasmatota bacterium]|nr:hypothetical protein KHQ81_15435 [Mycoplasmatota bacterium]